MKKVFKWIGIILGGFVLLLIVVAVVLSFVGNVRLGKSMDVQVESVSIPNGAAALERGKHFVQATCLSCHGKELSGAAVIDDPAIGTIYAPNITGVAERRSDDELVLAIRHGLAPEGRQLIVMPAESFISFSAEDLGAVIAYLKSVPPVENDLPDPALGILGRVMLAAGLFGQIFPADYIDHDQPFTTMPEIGANAEYGEYLTGLCTSCHGSDLKGGTPAEPGAPAAPNLTTGGRAAAWSVDGFVNAMRTGVTPDGQAIDPDYMPWQSFGKLDEEELRGLWMYLQTTSAE